MDNSIVESSAQVTEDGLTQLPQSRIRFSVGKASSYPTDDDKSSIKDTQSIITNDYEGDEEGETSTTVASSNENLTKIAPKELVDKNTPKISIKPAVFKGPPKLFQRNNNSNNSSPTIITLETSTSRKPQHQRIPEESDQSNGRIPIHTINELKPSFSMDVGDNLSSSDNETPEPVSDSAETTTINSKNKRLIKDDDDYDDDLQEKYEMPKPLTQEEIDLLVKLEQENASIMAKNDLKRDSIVQPPLGDINDIPEANQTQMKPENVAELEQDGDWDFWGRLLNDFENTLKRSNKILIKKIQNGLPKAVRGTVWTYFSRSHQYSFLKSILHPEPDSNVSLQSQASSLNSPISGDRFMPPEAFRSGTLEDAYVELLKLSSPYEKMIIRDLSRTFPKHEYFKHANGLGQESLFNVVKAYSLYDSEVGYCQGLSFVVGVLLLNMPDEQAFACLTHLMNTYQFRGMFTHKMELLQLRLYQFDRFLQELLPRINDHLMEQGVRSTMYASQWFLTIFSYRFPLEVVFRIMDIIFATGVVAGASGNEGGVMDGLMEKVSEGVAAVSGSLHLSKSQELGTEVALVLFRFAFALLKKNEEMILALEFEPLLEFLKHGLFDIYIGSADPSADLKRKNLHRKAIDDLVRDAMTFKGLYKKKMLQIRREYEEELKKSDPTYLAEKSLEAQNQRLANDLKRAEKMLAELNQDHCNLAGQLISMRIDLSKQKEVEEALRRQVGDLKEILSKDLSRFDRKDLETVLNHEVTIENSSQPAPLATPAPLTDEQRMPSLEEQVQILTNQNLKMIEEIQFWRTKWETLDRQIKTSANSSQTSVDSVSQWTKRLFNRTSVPSSPVAPPLVSNESTNDQTLPSPT